MNILAYIDPGTTALIWQIVAGVFIAFGVVLGIWWRKITTFFKSVWVKIFGKKKNATDDNLDTEDDELGELERDEETPAMPDPSAVDEEAYKDTDDKEIAKDKDEE